MRLPAPLRSRAKAFRRLAWRLAKWMASRSKTPRWLSRCPQPPLRWNGKRKICSVRCNSSDCRKATPRLSPRLRRGVQMLQAVNGCRYKPLSSVRQAISLLLPYTAIWQTGKLSIRRLIQKGYSGDLINYTTGYSLRFSHPSQYHRLHNHNKSVVNGASIADTFARTMQNKSQVFATE